MKLWENCVAIVKAKKKYLDAKAACESTGGRLARPQTHADVREKRNENELVVTDKMYVYFSST